MTEVEHTDTHHEVVDVTDPGRRPRVLMVVANPGISTTLGWPVGFWAAELFHPYHEFVQRRYEVTIASPDGGLARSMRCRTLVTSRGGARTSSSPWAR
jgi:putative intracellular protease/amidase